MTEVERLRQENIRLKERIAFLAYALAEMSAGPPLEVTEEQFSMLVREERVQ